MREITTHKVNGCNEAITITATDDPGPGGANHEYRLEVLQKNNGVIASSVEFQNGAIAEVGTNGITNEALLAIVIDRLRGFQNGQPGELSLTAKGPYACRENAIALTKLEEAMHWLHARTRARAARGVEGTMAK